MTEIDEWTYMTKLGNVPMIIWVRNISDSRLKFVDISGKQTILKETNTIEGRMFKFPNRRFFTLTDEEVERMIIPRII